MNTLFYDTVIRDNTNSRAKEYSMGSKIVDMPTRFVPQGARHTLRRAGLIFGSIKKGQSTTSVTIPDGWRFRHTSDNPHHVQLTLFDTNGKSRAVVLLFDGDPSSGLSTWVVGGSAAESK